MTDVTRRQFNFAAATLPLAGLLPIKSEVKDLCLTHEKKDFYELKRESFKAYRNHVIPRKALPNDMELTTTIYFSDEFLVEVPEGCRILRCNKDNHYSWMYGEMVAYRVVVENYYFRKNHYRNGEHSGVTLINRDAIEFYKATENTISREIDMPKLFREDKNGLDKNERDNKGLE